MLLIEIEGVWHCMGSGGVKEWTQTYPLLEEKAVSWISYQCYYAYLDNIKYSLKLVALSFCSYPSIDFAVSNTSNTHTKNIHAHRRS